jgi:hypothetical protein
MQFLFEDIWERLFSSPLESVELGHKLLRFMENQRFLLSDGRYAVPHVYDIYLSTRDHQQLSPNQNILVPDWQNQMIEYARHHQYMLRDTPVLRLHPDSTLRVGTVRIEVGSAGEIGDTQQLDPTQVAALIAQAPQIQPSGPLAQPDTQAKPGQVRPPTSHSQAAFMPAARLLICMPQGGQQSYTISKPEVRIGRQLDNDIIVEDKRVSRYHAQIKYQPSGNFELFDLGSTNGITINSVPNMRQHLLRNGDHFMIGSYDFQFQRQ